MLARRLLKACQWGQFDILIQDTLHHSPHKGLLSVLGAARKQHQQRASAAEATAAAAASQYTFRHGQARVLDGRAVAAAWQEELAHDVRDVHIKGGRPPGLGVVLVGSRPDSLLYVSRKREACERVGMFTEVRQLSASVTQRQLEAAVAALCADPRIDGVLVQLPLPRHIDEEAIIERFDPQKDVDGFHPLNMGRILMRGRSARFIPCTALGVIELLRRGGVAVRGKSVVVMGDSNVVGMPLAMLFRDAGAATVTVLHRTSYRELFADATSVERAAQRAQASACLPRIPGPMAAYAASSKPEAAAAQRAAGKGADAPQGQSGAPSGQSLDYPATVAGDPARPAPEQQRQQTPAPAQPAQQEHEQQRQQDVQQQQRQQQGAEVAGASPLPDPGSQHHPHVSDLPGITRTGDILVVAVGYPHLVKRDWVKPGAVVIDVGINVVEGLEGSDEERVADAQGQQQQQQQQHGGAGAAAGSGAHWPAGQQAAQQQGGGEAERGGGEPCCEPGGFQEDGSQLPQPFHVVGDVDFCDVAEVASALTPVPGGVGPMTIAAVLHNTVQAARYNLGLERYDLR